MMTAIRQNILTSAAARDSFLQGVVLLDQEMTGVRVVDLANFVESNGIPLEFEGINQELSMYDLFVFWHMVAAAFGLQVGNAAHGGPVFLPWHRMYLIRLEQELQRVLNDQDFGLPYWDWASDGELDPELQWRTELWSDQYLGEARGLVRSGPVSNMRVRLYQVPQTIRVSSDQPRPIWRQAALNAPRLPDRFDETNALDEEDYDTSPWSFAATRGHRNALEGFMDGTTMHNQVHVWVSGDMLPMSSPNDPVFFLNHCNVDRIWETWMADNGRVYRPRSNEGPSGHRVDDRMLDIFGGSMTPADVLDPEEWYTFDTLLSM